MKGLRNRFAFPIVFMIVTTVFFTFLLAWLNQVTSDTIALNEKTDLRSKILYVFDIDVEDNDPEIIEEIFNEHIESSVIEDKTIYFTREGDEVSAYAFPVEGIALWGSLEAYVAVTSDLTEILGIEFISHNETPGLGGRISEEWFKEQFRGLDLENKEDGKYIIYKPDPSGNVDAVTGATLTSNSVKDILNTNIHEFITEEVEMYR